jgi:hypothetical protein
VITVVAIGPVAVTTNYWEEYQEDGTEEIGCRVQLRRMREPASTIPPPQPRRDATYWSVEEPIWRADLFTTVGSPTALDASHYHPTFSGVQPCERVMDPAIFPDPYAWIEGRLADLPEMLTEAGYPELANEVDADAVRQAMPAILENIRATLRYRPAARAGVPV